MPPIDISTALLPDDSTFYVDTNLEGIVQDFLSISPAIISAQVAKTFPTIFPRPLARGALFSQAANPQAINLFPQSVGQFLSPVSRVLPATILYDLGPSNPPINNLTITPQELAAASQPLQLSKAEQLVNSIIPGFYASEPQVSTEELLQEVTIIPDPPIPPAPPPPSTPPPPPTISQQDATEQATGNRVNFSRRSGGRFSRRPGIRSLRLRRQVRAV